LQEDQRSIVGDRRRDSGCLARAGLGCDDQCPRSPKAIDDLGNERVNGERIAIQSVLGTGYSVLGKL